MRKKELAGEYRRLDNDYRLLLEKEIAMGQELEKLRLLVQKQGGEKDRVEQMLDNTRKLKHDMRNHLMVIAMSMNHEKYDEAKEYTSQILDKLNMDYSYVNSGNTLLNYILNHKITAAQSKGIHIKVEVENLKFERMESVDFAAVFGNLIDNAVAGAEKSREKNLTVSVRRKRGYDAILVKNSIDGSVLEENPELKTTKKNAEKHGLGIKQVKTLTEKYKGLADIYEENGMFCVSVMIPAAL